MGVREAGPERDVFNEFNLEILQLAKTCSSWHSDSGAGIKDTNHYTATLWQI